MTLTLSRSKLEGIVWVKLHSSITYGYLFCVALALALIALVYISFVRSFVRVESHLIRNNDPFIQNGPQWTVTRYHSLAIYRMDTLIFLHLVGVFFFHSFFFTTHRELNTNSNGVFYSMCRFVCESRLCLLYRVDGFPFFFLLDFHPDMFSSQNDHLVVQKHQRCMKWTFTLDIEKSYGSYMWLWTTNLLERNGRFYILWVIRTKKIHQGYAIKWDLWTKKQNARR